MKLSNTPIRFTVGAAALAIGVVVGVAPAARAGFDSSVKTLVPSDNIISYDLRSHADGNAASPFYGLRMDGLIANGHNTFNFDHEDAGLWLDYDVVNGSIHIHGQAFGGKDTGSEYDPHNSGFAQIDFWYSGVQATGTDGEVVVNSALDGSGGEGSITFDGVEYTLRSKSNGHYDFKLKYGHRLPGNDQLVGYGWMQYEKGGDWYGGNTGNTTDWLFEADPKDVPEPGVVLGLLSVGALSAIRKRRV
ncbi:MAG: PEP-CTERM sorting domain-containing protein [Geitlerinemataceae cyanobacterium]